MPGPYESLFVIKESTARIVEHIDSLKDEGLLGPDIAEIHKLMAAQVGAATCQSVMLNLAQREMLAASRSEKVRIKLEKKLIDNLDSQPCTTAQKNLRNEAPEG